MRILGLVLVTSLAVGYLTHTTARPTACDVQRTAAMADLPIYYGGTLAPVVVEAELQPAGSTKIAAQPAAASGARSAVVN